jgi:PilZ domain
MEATSTTTVRRSDRVCLTLLLEASGRDAEGYEFVEPARTMLISRHGGVIVVNRRLVAGQELRLRRTLEQEAHRSAVTRVIRNVGAQTGASSQSGSDSQAGAGLQNGLGALSGGQMYSVECVDPQADLWGVEFPALEGSQEFVARMLLECSFCGSREVVYLNEFELGGFEKNRGTARHCKVCDVPTIWIQAPHEVAKAAPVRAAGSVHAAGVASDSGAAADALEPGRRQALRLKTRLTACVRVPGSDDELAVCEEISADGLSFRCKRRFEENGRIDIAVPYADATANIFVPARVVRVEPTASAGLFRHGVEFLRIALQGGE